MQLPVQNRRAAPIIAAIVVGLAGVFWLPYFFPVRDGLSFSYMFGFSNRAATILLATFIFGFAVWTRGLGLNLPTQQVRSADSFRRTAFVAIFLSVGLSAFVWLFSKPFVAFDEAQYFLDRYEMFRQGRHIFRDFEFDYGPLMFYPATWIARLTGLSLVSGYYLAWIAQWGLGTWLLWKIVARSTRGTRHGRSIFLMFWGFFVAAILDSGANYTPLRFCITLAFALAVYDRLARGDSNLSIFGTAAIGAAVSLFYSPEQGITFTVGTILFFLFFVGPTSPRVLLGLGGFVLAILPAFWVASRGGELDNIRTVGSGSLNLPLIPTFQTIVLLLLLLAAGCAVVASLRSRTSSHPLLYLLCISLVSAPAAFSRADVGHIIINMLGALILALTVLSQYPAVWRWTGPAFAMVVVLFTYSHYLHKPEVVRDQIRNAAFDQRYRSPFVEKAYAAYMSARYSKEEAARLMAFRRSEVDRDYDPNAPQLPPHSQIFAPMGVHRGLAGFVGDPQIVTGYYPWLLPMTGTGMIPFKIAELESHPEWPLLLPTKGQLTCDFDAAGVRLYVKEVLLAPYMPPIRNRLSAGRPFCDYLNRLYRPTAIASPVPYYYIWVRRGTGTHP